MPSKGHAGIASNRLETSDDPLVGPGLAVTPVPTVVYTKVHLNGLPSDSTGRVTPCLTKDHPINVPTSIAIAAVSGLLLAGAPVLTADAHNSPRHNRLFDNCTNFNNKFEHGVGRRHAHDQTSGDPVTNFKRSNRIYERAMNHNRDLDRDRDRIACEKA